METSPFFPCEMFKNVIFSSLVLVCETLPLMSRENVNYMSVILPVGSCADCITADELPCRSLATNDSVAVGDWAGGTACVFA